MPVDDLPHIPKNSDSPLADTIAELEGKLENQRRARSAERFFFICVLIAGYDAHTFKSLQGWAGPVCLTFVEFAGLFVLADLTGVRNMTRLIKEVAVSAVSKKE